jgi:hypothetical protein
VAATAATLIALLKRRVALADAYRAIAMHRVDKDRSTSADAAAQKPYTLIFLDDFWTIRCPATPDSTMDPVP